MRKGQGLKNNIFESLRIVVMKLRFFSFHGGYAILSPYHLSTLMLSLCPEL